VAVKHARCVEMENAVPSEQTPEIGGAANQGLPAHETAVRDTALGVTETSECVTNSGDRPSRLSWSDEEIAAAQRQDREIGFVMTLVENNQEKPPWKEVELQSSAVKSLWTEWERLEIRGGVLKRKWVSTDGLQTRWQIILPVKFRKEFIKLIHSGMSNGHLGRAKTEEQIKFRTYWPNWAFDVKMELKRCEPCAQYHRGKAPHQSYLNPIMAGEPFEVIAVDITGKHPKSNKGNEYIVTVIDMFSKWAEAYPVRKHTAPVVARVLMDNLFARFGMPKRIISDQGAEFESQLFQELCRKMDIDKVRTSPYQPSTNGCIERFHRTLNSMVAKVIDQNQRDWDERLSAVMTAYRAAKHDSTGYSPNFLVLGRENRAPVDLVLGKIDGEHEHCDSVDDYVYEAQEKFR